MGWSHTLEWQLNIGRGILAVEVPLEEREVRRGLGSVLTQQRLCDLRGAIADPSQSQTFICEFTYSGVFVTTERCSWCLSPSF